MTVLAWKDWSDAVAASVRGVPDADLERAARIIFDADLVLTAGNGGSASLASHMAQAIAKPDYAAGGGRAAVCLTDMVPTLTAHANDGGWVDALAECALPFFDIRGVGLALVLFSSSGKSKNIIQIAESAAGFRCPIIAFTGFEGEPLRTMATVSLHVASSDYEVVEPAHDALLHRVQYHLRTIAKQE